MLRSLNVCLVKVGGFEVSNVFEMVWVSGDVSSEG